ncbi:flocculation protein FLO11 [Senna tora]|uniref:Flocculation protein FLO11 n=1 Tax=Senna tora TaxID=362788 RepID=A0A834TBN8_9FABA|nr:flocculation protein FLO11 [Senna tora]
MKTLVVVAQHRNQYYSRSKPQGPARFRSSPPKNYGGINCRTFQSGIGILPTPCTSCTSPVTKRPSNSSSPKTPSRPAIKTTPKSTPIPISGKPCNKQTSLSENFSDGSLLFSELWAGPTYSISPPPSSLPIPKFHVRPKRTVSLDLPTSSPNIEMHPIAKSAPSSPSGNRFPLTRDHFVTADSATKTLHRILNLNFDDE